MVTTQLFGLFLACVLSTVSVAAPSHKTLESRQSDCNTTTNRACWTTSPAFNINTDTETSWPETGVTRHYTFALTEVDDFVGGDGNVKRKAMLVNGQFPGPTIYADWGDRISVTVTNYLFHNGTSIHWHGLRQLNNNINDGASGVTECPIPPGGQRVYNFQATQHGSTWYHSHISSQYGNGATGSIVINGPASANYDIDLGAFPVSDWYYEPVDTLVAIVSNPATPFIPGFPGSPPPSDNVLFDGLNVNPDGSGDGGEYKRVALSPGKLHRLRLINPSIDNGFTLSLAAHTFAIVAVDLVPVQPQQVDSVFLAVGQRVDVVIKADQPAGHYWFNATFSASGACGLSNNPAPAAVFSYQGAADFDYGLPTDPGKTPPDSRCADLNTTVPVVPRQVPVQLFGSPNQTDTLNIELDVDNSVNRVFWPVNGVPANVSWNYPTLDFVRNGTLDKIPKAANVIKVPPGDIWSFWLIQNNSPIPHPMHLHGHDILILARSDSPLNPFVPGLAPTAFNATRFPLHGANPTRRDTAMLPAFGFLVLAFHAGTNPGAWLFHCHIVWHVSQGLSVQLVEEEGRIGQVMDLQATEDACGPWRAYFPENDPFPQTDSGI